MKSRPTAPPAVVIAAIATVAAAALIALTVLVTTHTSLGIDRAAADVADDLRAPWLDHAAKIVTFLGPLAVAGTIVVIGAGLLLWNGHRARAAALVAGVALTWIATQILKAAVDRPRPPAPLVHTTGASFPSGHAANSTGYLALAIALLVIIPTRRGRIAAVLVGGALAALVGLSRIYLGAHYLSDVLAGEALAVAGYAVAALAVLAWGRVVARS
jgi:membrane-associated phospholipid phosphatase